MHYRLVGLHDRTLGNGMSSILRVLRKIVVDRDRIRLCSLGFHLRGSEYDGLGFSPA